ncbi:MAG: ABC transporter ATP-binding protein [Paludibacteraceae bacterium]|nr:ABC transporter ATP-binding protein [Paludibacteraceae bacterium]
MMTILRILNRFIKPYKRLAALNIVFNMLATVLSLFSFAAIIPMLRLLFGMTKTNLTYLSPSAAEGLQQWLDIMQNNLFYFLQEQVSEGHAAQMLLLLGAFLVVMTMLKCGSSYLGMHFMIPLRTSVLRDLRQQLYDKVLSLPVGFFTEEHKGDIMSRMTNDVNEVEFSIMASLDMLFKNPIMILVYLVTLFVISWQLTLFVLILLPISGWIIGIIGKNLKKKSNIGQEQTGELLTQIEETISGLRVIKAFTAEKQLSDRFLTQNNRTRQTFNRLNRRYYLAHPMSEFLGTIVIAILLWYGGSLILGNHSTIDAPVFIYYLIIFYSIINPAKDLTRASYSVRKGSAALERIDKILQAQSEQDITDNSHITTDKAHIEYHNVHFSYNSDKEVIKGINLNISEGQTVAFVGESGGGKTTLVDLLPRFYDVTSGEIRINGINIKDLPLTKLRGMMGIVSQEAILFNDSFFANIAFGMPTATEQEVIEAAKVANAHEFIMQTAEGYQSSVGERGQKLSGGQRQRISIARAVLKNPPILILDEATSALDTENEKLVQQALEKLMHNRTTLVIAHRLSTIKNADLICVLHDGKIVEQGTHEQLLELKGYYYKLLQMQQ